MKKRERRHPNVKKMVLYAVVMNALQIVAVVTFAVLLYSDGAISTAPRLAVLIAAVLIVVWGAVLDIGDALSARHISEQSEMLEDACRQLEKLNGTLRAQRHDFMNHLQVVFSLIEMEEYQEAQNYINRVYEDIRRVSRVLRTGIPAVNALLAAKLSDCEGQGIVMETRIESAWKDMPIAGWELCRVLGNLIDNAVDALRETPDVQSPKIVVYLGEDAHDYTFSVRNNGAGIPEEIQNSIFEMGFTTKRTGQGMGLHIVSEIVRSHGGTIELNCAEDVCFFGKIPKPVCIPKRQEDAT